MCSCGEKCSSYEHFRYHPVGRMFECSSCSIWSHVLCVLGNICDDDLEELQVSCHTPLFCHTVTSASAPPLQFLIVVSNLPDVHPHNRRFSAAPVAVNSVDSDYMS